MTAQDTNFATTLRSSNMPLVANRYLRKAADPVVVRERGHDPVDDGDLTGALRPSLMKAEEDEKSKEDQQKDHSTDGNAVDALLDDEDDEDQEVISKVKRKAGRRKFTDAEAIAWVEEQIHEIHLQEEEAAIQAEYAELQQHMAKLELSHQEALEEPDQEERQLQMMMSDVAKEHDKDMQTHTKLEKLPKRDKSRRKSGRKSNRED